MKKLIFLLTIFMGIGIVAMSFTKKEDNKGEVVMPVVLHPENTYPLTLTSTGETVSAHVMSFVETEDNTQIITDLATDQFFVYDLNTGEMIGSSLTSEQLANSYSALSCLCCSCGNGWSCPLDVIGGCEIVDFGGAEGSCIVCDACGATLQYVRWGSSFPEGGYYCSCKAYDSDWAYTYPCVGVLIYP